MNDRNNPDLPSKNLRSQVSALSPLKSSVLLSQPSGLSPQPSSSVLRHPSSVLRPSLASFSAPPPRRSNEEQELSELASKTLLLPKDPAFYPDREALEWRVRDLVA